MKINCRSPFQDRFDRLHEWHRWFAWHPVRLNGGDESCRWLEYVARKGSFWECWGDGGWDWKYADASTVPSTHHQTEAK